MNILGMASTTLPGSLQLINDSETEEINVGGSVFEGSVRYQKAVYQDEHSLYPPNCVKVGNYLLFSGEDNKGKFYTILQTEKDVKNEEIRFYAEEAGLDLLNVIATSYEADKAYPIEHYINKWTLEAGWEIGINEASNLERKLAWEGESTVTERLLSVCTQFDHLELSYSFRIKDFVVTNKYINIHKKRGSSTDVTLRIDRDIDNIISTESIENLGTALYVTGGTQEGEDFPITLDGYSLTSEQSEGGRFKIIKNKDGESILCDTKANQIWSRFVAIQNDVGDLGYITKTYSYDTLSKSELCNRALTQLKRISNPEQNFEVAISKLPDTVRIGDRINIVDVDDELYLEARVLKLEKSRCKDEATATLGEYLIKSSGISDKLQILADEIKRGQKQLEIVASNGTKVFTGDQEPESPKKGDIWFQQNEDGTVDTVKWDGVKWDIVARDLENKEFEKQLSAALQDVADTKAASEEAYEKGIEAIAKGKEATIAAEKADKKAEEVKGQLQDAYEKSEQALSKADEAVTKVDNQAEIVAEAKEIAGNAVSKAATAKENADKAVMDATSALAGVSGVQESLDTEITRIDGELSSKVSQTEYNALEGTVASQGTQITQNKQTIEQKADSKTVDTLTGRVTTAEGKITTMAGQIELKASKSEVDTVKGSVTELDSKLTVESGKIAGLVTKTDGHSTEITNLKLKSDEFSVSLSKMEDDTVAEFSSINQKIGSLQTTVGNKAEQSQVTQLAGQITSIVSTVNGHTSQITQLGNQIDLKVSKNGVVSSINVSPETVRINAKWIHLSGTSLIDNAVIDTAHLKDASITNAKISSLSADKITSGSIDAGKINVLNLNADNIKSGKISALDIVGSKIVNTFDTTINSARVTGTTTLEKAELAIQYNLPSTSQSGKISINPLSISGRVNKSTGAIQNMWELSAGALLLNDGIHSGTLMAKSLVDNQWWYLGLKSGFSWYGNPDNAYRPRTKLVYIQNKQAMRTSGIITRSSGGGGGNWQGIGTWAASSAGFNLVRDISVIATIQNGTSATISFQRGGDVAVRCPQDWTELRWDAFVGVED